MKRRMSGRCLRSWLIAEERVSLRTKNSIEEGKLDAFISESIVSNPLILLDCFALQMRIAVQLCVYWHRAANPGSQYTVMANDRGSLLLVGHKGSVRGSTILLRQVTQAG